MKEGRFMEIKNKKVFMRVASVFTVAAIMTTSAVMLTGCRSGNSSSGGNNGEVSVSISDWPTTEPGLSMQNEKKDKFEAENPNIKIVPDTWTFDLQTFYPKAAAGLLPNQFSAYYSEIENLINTGYLADVTDVAKEMGIYDKLNPTVREIAEKDGRLYAIPNDSYAEGIVVNMDMLKQAGYIEADGTPHQPKDWYELAEMAQKIKQVTGKPGFVLPTAANNGGWLFTQIAWGFGVNFMEKKDGKWTATFNTNECVEALQYVKDLKWKYDCLPSDIIVDGTAYGKIFATGGAAMTFGSGGGTPKMVINYDMDKEDLGMVAIPAGPKGRYALMGGMLICISNKTNQDQQRAIFKWLNLTDISETEKESYKTSQQTFIDKGIQVGPRILSSFTDSSPRQAFYDEWREQNVNVNEANFKLYNDSLNDPSITLRAEEPRCAQDLYGILDGCLQQVLQDKNADCRAILEEANKNFQEQYLNDQEN